MQSGELVVSGRDKIHIVLKSLPERVNVHFVDDCEIVPCNPHHTDSLEYEVHASHTHHHGFTLIISWHVHGVREIKWSVHY